MSKAEQDNLQIGTAETSFLLHKTVRTFPEAGQEPSYFDVDCYNSKNIYTNERTIIEGFRQLDNSTSAQQPIRLADGQLKRLNSIRFYVRQMHQNDFDVTTGSKMIEIFKSQLLETGLIEAIEMLEKSMVNFTKEFDFNAVFDNYIEIFTDAGLSTKIADSILDQDSGRPFYILAELTEKQFSVDSGQAFSMMNNLIVDEPFSWLNVFDHPNISQFQKDWAFSLAFQIFNESLKDSSPDKCQNFANCLIRRLWQERKIWNSLIVDKISSVNSQLDVSFEINPKYGNNVRTVADPKNLIRSNQYCTSKKWKADYLQECLKAELSPDQMPSQIFKYCNI